MLRLRVEVARIDVRRIEHLTGEVQASVLNARQELDPVARRLRQHGMTDDAWIIEWCISTLGAAIKLLSQIPHIAGG